MIQNRPLVILGSKEYVAEILSSLEEGTAPSMIYLSDDSLGAAKVQQEALRLATPVFVTALRRIKGKNKYRHYGLQYCCLHATVDKFTACILMIMEHGHTRVSYI